MISNEHSSKILNKILANQSQQLKNYMPQPNAKLVHYFKKKSVLVIHHINRLESYDCINTRKTFDKIPHSMMIESFHEPRNRKKP